MKKVRLREKYLARRQAMDAGRYHQQSQQIQARFFQHFNLAHYPYIHTYLACAERREVDTWGIVHVILSQYPQVVLAVPKLLGGPGQMESCPIDQATTFQSHAWGMQEPTGGRRVPAADFLLVILPVIAFDKHGYRVGYGQGYYDRFLQQCRPDVTKVGLCFAGPVSTVTDLHMHDVPMDYCVTPSQVFRWTHKA